MEAFPKGLPFAGNIRVNVKLKSLWTDMQVQGTGGKIQNFIGPYAAVLYRMISQSQHRPQRPWKFLAGEYTQMIVEGKSKRIKERHILRGFPSAKSAKLRQVILVERESLFGQADLGRGLSLFVSPAGKYDSIEISAYLGGDLVHDDVVLRHVLFICPCWSNRSGRVSAYDMNGTLYGKFPTQIRLHQLLDFIYG